MYKAVLLLFTVFVLAGCAQRAQGAAPSAGADGTPFAVESSGAAAGTNDKGAGDTGAPNTASITLTPATGYAGTFVGVTGTGWPPSAMVLIKLADAQGRSPVLAAVAADAKGQFTTGFVYPVGDRWLQPGAAAVVAHIESGQVETAASFAIAPPAGVQPPTSTPTNAPPSPTAVSAVTLPITATIPFTSGALAATLAPTVIPIPTATPLPTATPVPTALPSATAASTPTAAPTATAIATATAAPSTEIDAYSAPVSTIDELIAAIRTMPSGDLAPELANSLVQKLNNAQKQVDKGHATPAANMLRAFQHEVAAQWGKKIDDAAANFLTASADNVITHLQPDQPAENGKSSDNGRGTDENKGSDKGNGNDKGKGKGNGNANGNGNGNRNDKGNGKGKGHG